MPLVWLIVIVVNSVGIRQSTGVEMSAMDESETTFHYITGESVQLGDIVLESEGLDEERVDQIFEPWSDEADGFMCYETGGILLEPSSALVEPGSAGWEDLVFVRRGGLDAFKPPRPR